MTQIETYIQLEEKYAGERQLFRRKVAAIGVLRLAVIIALLCFIYYAIVGGHPLLFSFAAATAGMVYLALLKWHGKVYWQQALSAALGNVNREEINFLQGQPAAFDDGTAYIDHQHAYTYDLDIFGHKSLYQHLNRTGTVMGGQALARQLATQLNPAAITATQDAVKELRPLLDWRQHLQAVGTLIKDNQTQYDQLLAWASQRSKPVSRAWQLWGYASPAIIVAMLVAYFAANAGWCAGVATLLFVVNLLLLALHMQPLRQEQVNSQRTDETIQQYSLLFRHFEQTPFESAMLQKLQAQLHSGNTNASGHLHRLSRHFNSLDSLQNLLGAVIFNGCSLYHLHVLRAIQHWKAANAGALKNWLETLGHVEALCSLANFSYNNQGYAFPQIADSGSILFNGLGHPLIAETKRVCNDIQFAPQHFMILTGSNMSGKSTFLRTLGLNMVLAGAGAPVCAKESTLTPLPVLVSMRLTDSLADSESFFFAEVKRLRQILDALEKNPCFVLLDEILRGTNSDDKQFGTIGVIKSMLRHPVTGAIATHDLEVCKTAALFPDRLLNKCFEVEIIDNNLHFDYTIREGICKNKSATFLMKKMKII